MNVKNTYVKITSQKEFEIAKEFYSTYCNNRIAISYNSFITALFADDEKYCFITSKVLDNSFFREIKIQDIMKKPLGVSLEEARKLYHDCNSDMKTLLLTTFTEKELTQPEVKLDKSKYYGCLHLAKGLKYIILREPHYQHSKYQMFRICNPTSDLPSFIDSSSTYLEDDLIKYIQDYNYVLKEFNTFWQLVKWVEE